MLISLKDFVEKRKSNGITWPTIFVLYKLHFRNPSRIRECVFKKLGGKVLIDPKQFEKWLLESTNDPSIWDAKVKKSL